MRDLVISYFSSPSRPVVQIEYFAACSRPVEQEYKRGRFLSRFAPKACWYRSADVVGAAHRRSGCDLACRSRCCLGMWAIVRWSAWPPACQFRLPQLSKTQSRRATPNRGGPLLDHPRWQRNRGLARGLRDLALIAAFWPRLLTRSNQQPRRWVPSRQLCIGPHLTASRCDPSSGFESSLAATTASPKCPMLCAIMPSVLNGADR